VLSKPFNKVAPSLMALRDRARGIEGRNSPEKSLDFSDYHLMYNSDFGEDFEESHPNVNLHDTFNEDEIAFSEKSPSPINEHRSTVADSEITMLNSVKLDSRTAIYRDVKRLERNKKYSFFSSFNSSNTPDDQQLFDLSDFYPEPERFRTEVAASLSSMSTSLQEKTISMKKNESTKVFSDDSSCDGFVNHYNNVSYKSSMQEGVGIATPPMPAESPFLNDRTEPPSENRIVESRIKLLQRNFKHDTPCSPLPPKHNAPPIHSANTVRLSEIYPNNEEVFQSNKLARESVMNMSDVYPEEVGIQSVATLEIIRLEFPAVELTQIPPIGGGLGSNNSSRPPSPMYRGARARSDSQNSLNLQECAANNSMNYGSPSPLPQLRSMKSKRQSTGPLYNYSSPMNQQQQQQQPHAVIVSRKSRDELMDVSDYNYTSPQSARLQQQRWSGRTEPPVEIADDYYTPPGNFRTKASRSSQADTQESYPADDFNSPQSVKFRAIRTKFETMIQKNTNANRVPKLSRLTNTPT